MGKRFSTTDLSKLSDDKALAIAAYGEAVAAYRYIELSEKARDSQLRDSFEQMARDERAQRDRIQGLLARIAPAAGFYLSQEDKLAVCVGPRLVDARDDARFDEAMKLVIASEKRSASFYLRYAVHARDPDVRTLFSELAEVGLGQVQRLRKLLAAVGRQIAEPCPVSQLRMA
ncbi:MAG TPA: ferritin family protein [Phycisphaerae bacterium]|jgi:rubrerythrin|nr:ferritin family protein [Phycisphaerae bacterium]